MAAKKKNTQRAKASRKPSPAEQPSPASDQAEEAPTPKDDATAVESNPGPPVAGIGASAGGLDAFKKLFAAMPADSGIAFVLIPHLDPNHQSLMVELISRHTLMPVVEAKEGMPVEPNHIYVIPPNKYITIAEGVLRLTGPVERFGAQTSIDLFLRSLADDQQEKAICIILSGTGAHGTLGLQAVKAAGGMAMVQDPATADYPLMPQNAVATGLADYVLPVEQMPEALIKYIRHYYVNGDKPGAEEADALDHLDQVLALVRARTRLDFRPYRKKMLARRVERRLGLGHFSRLADYLAFLRGHPEELKHLSRDLLISVTSFFRDPGAWRALDTQVIAPLVRARDPDAPIRVWSVGCATGEEPYSLGMLLLEQLAAAQKHCPVQIFATDVDEDALEVARHAIYPESISADVSRGRLSRFFTRVSDSSYQVSKQLREVVIFARQNVLTDAPFSKLDLVVCRNLLIYLEPEVQKSVISVLHFALTEGGCLFLGSSETVGRSADVFEAISTKWRIYRRIGPARANALHFPAMQLEPRRARAQPPGPPRPPARLAELAQNFLLRRFALASVVINRNHEVLHFAGPTEDYLVQPAGPPTPDLLSLAREGIQSKLRVVIQRAIRENKSQTIKDVMMRHGDTTRRVNIDVEPLNLTKQTEGLLLVAFQEQPNPIGETLAEAKTRTQTAESDLLRQLEQELETTREDLQSTIEELESSNEELKASNEEIMSMNEELQSTNEEMETSKEELQSLNEELTTVNSQLHDKVQDLESANNDITNLLNCTDIATVFLDTGFRIRRFTPAATSLFNLIPTDVGRPIGDIVKKFTDDDLLRDAQQFLRELTPREKEVCTDAGRWCARRITPYRTRDNRIDGVVMTFVDVTERKQAADAVVRHLAAIVEGSADAILSEDLDGTIRTWNKGAERLYGHTPEEAIGRSTRLIVPDDRVEELTQIMSRLARGEYVEQVETQRLRKDGQRVAVALTFSPLRDGDGNVVGASVTARDITERKRAEEVLQLQGQVAATLAEGVNLVRARDAVFVYTNEPFDRMFGYAPGELLGRPVNIVNAGDGRRPDETAEEIISALREHGMWKGEVHNVKKDGTTFWTHASVSTFEHPAHGTVWVGALTDITERKTAEAALRDREARLSAILETAGDAIITIDRMGIVQSVNRATKQMFGYTAAEMVGQNVSMLMPAPYRDEHDAYMARYRETGEKHIIGISREVKALRKDGSVFPADLAVTEIEHLGLFTGVHRDLTERKQLERDVVEAASLEQRRIGQDLHDTVGQELTALTIQAGDLGETLRTDPAGAAQLVEQMVQGLQRSQQELRAVLRGLVPVAVDSEGLMAALADLAERTRQEGKAACTFDCPEPVAVADNLVATHLYLIAQEAVHNAVKHARPRNIRIALESNELLVLRVQDDGTGMPARPADAHGGLGLRIMYNRAAIIGATLTIEPVQPAGTLVTCTLVGKNR